MWDQFLILSTMDIWGWIIVCCGGPSWALWNAEQHLSLHPLDASSAPGTPPLLVLTT